MATYINFEDKPKFDEVEPLADKFIREFISGNVDAVDVAYMKFHNPARQFPVVETILPFAKPTESSGSVVKKMKILAMSFCLTLQKFLKNFFLRLLKLPF